MKKTLYSPRLDKDFELEVCTPRADQIVGNGSDITVVRAIALENILYNELAGAVHFDWKEIGTGAIVVDLYDDAGVHVVGVGDIANKGLRNDVARSFPEATAWSRAISAAVVKYLGFEGRVYTEASFEIENTGVETDIVSVSSSESTVKASSTPKTEKVEENPVEADPLAAATTIAEEPDEAAKEDFADYIWTGGKAKGMTVREILSSDDSSKFFFSDKENVHTRGYMYLKYLSDMEKTSPELKAKIKNTLKRVDHGELK